MFQRLRALLPLLLAALVAASAVTTAAARGQALAGGEVVICSGGQVVTLRLDANGNPAGPMHVCPDCVLTLFSGPLPGGPATHRAAGCRAVAFDPAAAFAATPAPSHAPNARAPPPSV